LRRTLMRVILAAIVALAAVLVVASRRYTGKVAVKLPAADCNVDLWKHVYEPSRLRVIEACTAVEGRVVSVHRAQDGDLHIGLDPDQKSVLNLVNVIHAQRNLIVEAVCDHPATSNETRASCAGFTSPIVVPKIGDRIRATGSYVTDRENGWNEIHPASKIEIFH
jgi:hypothetical protein